MKLVVLDQSPTVSHCTFTYNQDNHSADTNNNKKHRKVDIFWIVYHTDLNIRFYHLANSLNLKLKCTAHHLFLNGTVLTVIKLF